jgi:hypothetical protein
MRWNPISATEQENRWTFEKENLALSESHSQRRPSEHGPFPFGPRLDLLKTLLHESNWVAIRIEDGELLIELSHCGGYIVISH